LERHHAFLDAMASHGIAVDQRMIRYCEAFTEESGLWAARDLIAAEPGITAVVAGNDLIALGCYQALSEQGLSCPADVSVVGFNDMPFVDKQRPALTTVRIPHYELGVESARLLLERIGDPHQLPAKQVVLPVQVMERESVTRPRN
jgi:LacI family transcriptional regulator